MFINLHWRISEMNIRKILEQDIDVIYRSGISEINFQIGVGSSSFWTKDVLQRWVKSDSDVTLLAEEENSIKGFVLANYHAPTRKAVIENLWVHSKHRNKGIGLLLMRECLEQLLQNGAQFVCAFTKDDVVISFLEKNNFEKGQYFAWMNYENHNISEHQ